MKLLYLYCHFIFFYLTSSFHFSLPCCINSLTPISISKFMLSLLCTYPTQLTYSSLEITQRSKCSFEKSSLVQFSTYPTQLYHKKVISSRLDGWSKLGQSISKNSEILIDYQKVHLGSTCVWKYDKFLWDLCTCMCNWGRKTTGAGFHRYYFNPFPRTGCTLVSRCLVMSLYSYDKFISSLSCFLLLV